MSTYEDSLLAARFAALAPEPLPGDWADVVEKAGVAGKGRLRLRRSDTLRRRRRLVVVFAAVALVAVVTASALAVRAFVLDRGFIGLPPQGATPSTPESGKLEINYWVWSPQLRRPPTWPGDGDVGRSQAWVYADGRLLWLREATVPEGANRFSSGFLEQRLTREGVELLRSEIVSTGLFGHDLTLRSDRPGENKIEIRDADRLVSVVVEHDCSGPASGGRDRPKVASTPKRVLKGPGCVQWTPGAAKATPEQAKALEQLVTRLNDPASWLPASAWAERELRAYVPSRFAVCYGWPWHRFEPSQILPLLPAAVEDLLRARGRRSTEWSSGGQYCSDVTTEEARALARALDAAGLERSAPRSRLGYRVKVPGPIRDPAVIGFEPYLPHGETTCSACG